MEIRCINSGFVNVLCQNALCVGSLDLLSEIFMVQMDEIGVELPVSDEVVGLVCIILNSRLGVWGCCNTKLLLLRTLNVRILECMFVFGAAQRWKLKS